jgi:hypothetical protein
MTAAEQFLRTATSLGRDPRFPRRRRSSSGPELVGDVLDRVLRCVALPRRRYLERHDWLRND